jgi:phosphoglucomutase
MILARNVPTQRFFDQRCGPAGLRRKVTVFQPPRYLENFLQPAFGCLPALRLHCKLSTHAASQI